MCLLWMKSYNRFEIAEIARDRRESGKAKAYRGLTRMIADQKCTMSWCRDLQQRRAITSAACDSAPKEMTHRGEGGKILRSGGADEAHSYIILRGIPP